MVGVGPAVFWVGTGAPKAVAIEKFIFSNTTNRGQYKKDVTVSGGPKSSASKSRR